MKIGLIRREYITHINGVNTFITFLTEGLVKLGYKVAVFSWCFQGIERERLAEWFKETHGLDITIPIHTLKEEPCRGDPWFRIGFDWLTKGSKLLLEEGVDAVIVNGVVPLLFKPKRAVNHGITLKTGRIHEFLAKERII